MMAMGKAVSIALAAALVSATACSAVWAQGADQLIDQAMVGNHRAEANKARDKYRHPKETLLFFGLAPGMTVVEISPSRGWYTEILAPVLRDAGQYYAAVSAVTEKSPDAVKKNDADYRGMLAAAPGLYGKVKLSAISPGGGPSSAG